MVKILGKLQEYSEEKTEVKREAGMGLRTARIASDRSLSAVTSETGQCRGKVCPLTTRVRSRAGFITDPGGPSAR